MKTIYSLMLIALSTFAMMNAAAQQPGDASPGSGQIGIEIGAFMFLGSDLQVLVMSFKALNSMATVVIGSLSADGEDDFRVCFLLVNSPS